MKIFRFNNLMRALVATCLIAGTSVSFVSAQTTETTTPAANESVEVTDMPATWVQVLQANGIEIPAGADGVVISNGEGGNITASLNAIVTSADTTIINAGNIAGGTNAINFVNGQGTGSVTNLDTGVIRSESRAINIGGSVAVSNAGQILGDGDQRNGTIYADGVADNFSVDNQAGGLIDAGAGNQGSGVGAEIGDAADGANTFSLSNAGKIQGRGNAGAASSLAGDGVRVGNVGNIGTAEATINNSGTIDSEGANGTVAGVRFVNGISFAGELNNTGTISGTQNGLYFGNDVNGQGADHSDGVVNNSGTISSDSRALNIDGLGLTVNNDGKILGTGNQRNGTAYADGTADDYTINNRAGGSIDAGAGNEGSGFGAEIGGAADGANTFSLTNAGKIQGRGNASAGASGAGDGIRIGNVGNIGTAEVSLTNSGTIDSEGANGTVAGVRFVNGISFAGELNNTGVISGTQNGLYFGNDVNGQGADHSDGVVSNLGVISSDSRALNIDGLGLTINNDGLILGTGDQRNGTVYADSTAQDFTLNNAGAIDAGVGNQGAGFSVELSDTGNAFTINNSGNLRGRGTANAGLATAGDGIRLERSRVGGVLEGSTTGLFTGVINNTGSITSEGDSGTTGGFRAVNGVSFQGTLNNSGTISGVQNGVYFGNPTPAGGGDHTGGVVNNFGVISSDSRAFNLDGEGLQVNNFGDILATGAQRNGTFYVDGTADNFALNNSGSIDATGGSGSAVSIQVGSFDGDVQNGQIVNSGSFIGSGDSGVDAGLRLFTNAETATFSGDIINEAGGVIAADGSPAVLIESDVLFGGTLVNAGVIDGSIDLGSGNLELLDSSFLSLEIGSYTDFETVDLTGDLYFDGTLELDFLNPLAFEVGQTIDLFNFGSASGSFDTILSGALTLDVSNLASQGTVSVAAITAVAVPEPSAFSLLALSGAVFLRRRRNASC